MAGVKSEAFNSTEKQVQNLLCSIKEFQMG
jgi:hypothetical protein